MVVGSLVTPAELLVALMLLTIVASPAMAVELLGTVMKFLVAVEVVCWLTGS
jgi:hypothetical protein